MKELFSLRTVQKKIVMLSKLAGIVLIFSYILSTHLPVSEDASFLLWLGFVLLLVLGIDFFMGRFITKPIDKLNASAKRMAELDFSVPCDLVSTDEFGELSASLNTMADDLQQTLARLEDSLAERKELVDSLSHEMKTPLGIIRAYAEGLQDEADEGKKQRYAQVILSEVERMNDLIVTLLDLSALESGASELVMETLDFVELAETAAGRLLTDIPDADFQLEYELPEEKIFVKTDRKRMEQVLDNLILNARKNVCPGGRLELSLTMRGDLLHFSILNEGKAIPEEILPRIWTKFYRNPDTGYHGSGLGLSIVAQILSMQNLDYGVKNMPDGVMFYFSIPGTCNPSRSLPACR